MVNAFMVIFSLNASGQGAIMVDVLPSMEVCRQAVAYRKARGDSSAHCAPTADLVRAALELNRCELVRDTLYTCAGRLR